MLKKTVFALLVFAFAQTASANCIPSDFIGTWVMYQTNISATVPHTGRCEIKVVGSRNFTGMCNLSVGVDMDVTGTANVNSACEGKINMVYSSGSMDFDVQLAPDRQGFVGRWTNSFGNVGGSSGVRK